VSTGPEGWLLVERPRPDESEASGSAPERKYYVSSLPADTPLSRLVELAHARWAIEQFYEDAKGACGLDDYQGRRWDGLQRHLALVMLAYSFLAVQALQALPELAGPTGADAAGAFPPGTPAQSASSPSPNPGLAVPGSRPLAHRDQPNTPLPPT